MPLHPEPHFTFSTPLLSSLSVSATDSHSSALVKRWLRSIRAVHLISTLQRRNEAWSSDWVNKDPATRA
ncbi:hypothetical protein BU23DRAFT_556407 [Bimuria novae-zelandiae CBS 107.79]|uniref:Uncharacterized protein n=1 Tax=Bimuria novae-zelandiae CBS 107.79 TaxID=1447943 RepID=A0A6A5V0E6_9PLEO|nr:hypothetical protein BU23DRAFT_556407 [Bimuria novae-zelandiae CBS 107.79]